MKQRVIVFFLALSLVMTPGLVQSQETNYGLKGGLTWSNLYIDEDDLNEENTRLGFHGGLFSQFMFGGIIGIQPEFLFTTKGTEGEYTGILDQSVSFNMNYIDIPVLLVLRPVPVVELHAGAYGGILLNSNISFDGVVEGETELNRDHFNPFDFGLAAGIAFNFGNVQAGVRYNMGLREIADSNAARALLGDSKNSYGQVFLAIKFPGRNYY
jgi:hypothetical protein